MLLQGLLTINGLRDYEQWKKLHLGQKGNSSFLSQAVFVFNSSHNDFALRLRIFYQNKLSGVNLRELNKTHTNLAKLQAGYVGAQVRTAMVLSLRTYFYICLHLFPITKVLLALVLALSVEIEKTIKLKSYRHFSITFMFQKFVFYNTSACNQTFGF